MGKRNPYRHHCPEKHVYGQSKPLQGPFLWGVFMENRNHHRYHSPEECSWAKGTIIDIMHCYEKCLWAKQTILGTIPLGIVSGKQEPLQTHRYTITETTALRNVYGQRVPLQLLNYFVKCILYYRKQQPQDLASSTRALFLRKVGA